MKSLRSAAMLIVVLFAALWSLGQGHVDIVHEKPLKVRHLAGTVVDPTGASIEYAEVELHDSGDHRLLASTFADAQGRFSFADRKRSEKLEIRARSKGFNAVQYSVLMATFGREHLRIVLPAAT